MNEKTANINHQAYRLPIRFFEDSGTVNPEAAYCVDLENVTNTKHQNLQTMVDLGRYFSMFAPRQSGKTTFLEKKLCLARKRYRENWFIISSYGVYTWAS